ncbi:hypothetical protein QJS10_CPA03g01605 [Acorus calamus]|uniref:Uncharacterized protein n=1 Tax=Acorus calamus TaxID=4465 RepID=A0AAV9F9P1_ACOCL|nr:hypothetical protein QJS10_CPA03g01605 [Acorus calamus]
MGDGNPLLFFVRYFQVKSVNGSLIWQHVPQLAKVQKRSCCVLIIEDGRGSERIHYFEAFERSHFNTVVKENADLGRYTRRNLWRPSFTTVARRNVDLGMRDKVDVQEPRFYSAKIRENEWNERKMISVPARAVRGGTTRPLEKSARATGARRPLFLSASKKCPSEGGSATSLPSASARARAHIEKKQ